MTTLWPSFGLPLVLDFALEYWNLASIVFFGGVVSSSSTTVNTEGRSNADLTSIGNGSTASVLSSTVAVCVTNPSCPPWSFATKRHASFILRSSSTSSGYRVLDLDLDLAAASSAPSIAANMDLRLSATFSCSGLRRTRPRLVYAYSRGNRAGSNNTWPAVVSRPALSFFPASSTENVGAVDRDPAAVTVSLKSFLSLSGVLMGRPGNVGGSSNTPGTSVPETPMVPLSALMDTGATSCRPLSRWNVSAPLVAVSSRSGAASTCTVATWSGGTITAPLPPLCCTDQNSWVHATFLPSAVMHRGGGGGGLCEVL